MHSAPPSGPEILRHYNEAGPHYATYPTAAQFHVAFGEAQLVEQARLSNAELIPRPVSIYVRLPSSGNPRAYRGSWKTNARESDRYVERLLRQVEFMAPLFDRDREIVQIHFVGDTRDLLKYSRLEDVIRSLDRNFYFSNDEDRDFSIELDPRFSGAREIEFAAELGFNRVTLGALSLASCGRGTGNQRPPIDRTLAAIEACRSVCMASVTVNLIYGLPRQCHSELGASLDTAIAGRPDRVALHGYAHRPQPLKTQRQIGTAASLERDHTLALLGLAAGELTIGGYVHIGMDHFALPGDRLAVAQRAGALYRNLLGYTTYAECDLLGLGVGAINQIGRSYCQNEKRIRRWEAAVDAGRRPVFRGRKLTPDDEMRARIIQDVMCQGRIDIAAIEARFGVDFNRYFATERQRLAALSEDGLLDMRDGVITAASRGSYLCRIIAMCFDRYLHQDSGWSVDLRRPTTT